MTSANGKSIKSFRKYIFAGAINYEERSDGGKGSILHYNQRFATSIGWIFTRPGSIFTLFELTSVLVFGAGSATGIAAIEQDYTRYLFIDVKHNIYYF
jgi:hypothetical protein